MANLKLLGVTNMWLHKLGDEFHLDTSTKACPYRTPELHSNYPIRHNLLILHMR